MSDRWDRLVDAVGEAALLDDAAAQRHLQDTLSDDPGLLTEATRILAGGREEDTFLLRNPEGSAPTAALVEGSVVGSYRLLRLLGQGGMGSVFLAQQETPQRLVALKILRSALLTPKARRRLEYEIQALASLRHPGIAQIHEAGVHADDDGLLHRERPWFAMEYVEDATTVLAYVEGQGLDRDARLRLFLQICEAVQHGHEKGVVHRDLKPDNLLVDKTGQAKVIDFGVAKSTLADQPLTTMGSGVPEIVGTLPYLSPERVTDGRAVADVRTDVYALGVVLYQLLSGELPIRVDPADIVTSARRICRDTPLRPSQLDAGLPTDLDAVVMKALAKDPAQRYGSVEALAYDLERFLDDMPVLARPPSLSYQFRLFARRHKAIVLSSTVVALLLLASTWISLRFAMQSRDSEQEAVAQRRRTEGVIETVVQRNMENTLRVAPAINDLAGGKEHVEAFMTALAEDLETLERLAEDDPRVLVLLAQAHIRLGDTQGNAIQENLGRPEDARASYLRALSILASAPPGLEASKTALDARLSLGELLLQRGTRLQRRGEPDASVRSERRLLLTDALAEARTLHDEHPGDRGAARILATVHHRLGSTEYAEGNDEAATAHADAILALDSSGDLDCRRMAHDILAWLNRRLENWAEAAESFRFLVEASEQDASADARSFGQRRILCRRLALLGEAAGMAGDYETAIRALERNIEMREALQAEDPDQGETSTLPLLISLHQLGATHEAHARAQEDESGKRSALARALATFRSANALLGEPNGSSGHAHAFRERLASEIKRIEDLLSEPATGG